MVIVNNYVAEVASAKRNIIIASTVLLEVFDIFIAVHSFAADLELRGRLLVATSTFVFITALFSLFFRFLRFSWIVKLTIKELVDGHTHRICVRSKFC